MRFMLLYKTSKETTAPPTATEIAEMGTFIGEMAQSGILIAADGLQPSARGSRVRIAGGKFLVTDGPFAETKELIAGFAIVQVNSKEEAIEQAKRFLTLVGEGESEVRQMHDQPAYPPQ
jgi:hypothetical protein